MSITTKEYRERLARLAKRLKETSSSAAAIVLPAADTPYRTHDQHHRFFQDRDFEYFTGLTELQNAVLVLSTEITTASRQPILFVKKRTAKQKVWDGPGALDARAVAALGITLVQVDDLQGDVRRALQGIATLYINPARSSFSAELAHTLLATPHYELQTNRLPQILAQSQSLTAPLRAVKSKAEIQLIRNAVSLTESALVEVLRVTRPGYSEIHLARLFEGLVREAGGQLAFDSIVASGANAAVLHHTPSARKLRKGELVLFDVGASLAGYNGDISRTVSLAAPAHVEKLLTHVDAAQERIARLLRVGKRYADIKQEAVALVAEQISKSDLPVRGSAKVLVKSGAVRKFFPHNFGHSLGLDVHDPLPADAKLAANMVFTVEPGIYLAGKLGRYPALGIRIEDDFFVSPTGPKIFSSIPQLIAL